MVPIGTVVGFFHLRGEVRHEFAELTQLRTVFLHETQLFSQVLYLICGLSVSVYIPLSNCREALMCYRMGICLSHNNYEWFFEFTDLFGSIASVLSSQRRAAGSEQELNLLIRLSIAAREVMGTL